MSLPNIIVQLIHIEGPYKGRIDEFTDDVITIGRDPGCHVAFPPDLNIISRKHAEIRREGNRFKIIDSSTNGTFIRGGAIEETYLKNGDVIVFSEEGPKVSFLMTVQEATEDISDKTLDRFTPDAVAHEIPKGEIKAPQSRPMPAETPPIVSFTIQYGPSIHTFKQASLRIGADERCDFVLQESGIAAFHVEMFYQEGHYWIKDMSGEARALLNARPLVTPTVLRVRDVLELVKQGTAFEYWGDGKLVQKQRVVQQPQVPTPEPVKPPVSPYTPPVTPAQAPPTPQQAPSAPTPISRPAPRPPDKAPREHHIPAPARPGKASRFSIPVWIWVALGSAALVAVLVYFIAQWASK